MQLIKEELEEVQKSGIDKKEFEIMQHQFDVAKSNVERWQQHILRSVCQQLAWKEATEVGYITVVLLRKFQLFITLPYVLRNYQRQKAYSSGTKNERRYL